MKKREIEFHRRINQIFDSGKMPVEKLSEGFDFILSRVLIESEREMEILRAMGDQGGLVKEQIKHSTIQHVMEVFGDCYFRASGEHWERASSQMTTLNDSVEGKADE